jgi:hypothetical protein
MRLQQDQNGKGDILMTIQDPKNEECQCGHLQITHMETEYGIPFHGHCVRYKCECIKYTYKRRVY